MFQKIPRDFNRVCTSDFKANQPFGNFLLFLSFTC